LMVRGAPAERERGDRAGGQKLGINYPPPRRPTAAASRKNLGVVLRALRRRINRGQQVRLSTADLADVPGALGALGREQPWALLGRGRLDLFHLHNPIGAREERAPPSGSPTCWTRSCPRSRSSRSRARSASSGDGARRERALHRVLASAPSTRPGLFQLLSPGGGTRVPMGFPAQDFDGLARLAGEHGVGTIGIRVLAAGALSGQVARHPSPSPRWTRSRGSGLRHRCGTRRAFEPLVARAMPPACSGRFPLCHHDGRDVHRADRHVGSGAARLRRGRRGQGPTPRPPPMERVRAVWAKLAGTRP